MAVWGSIARFGEVCCLNYSKENINFCLMKIAADSIQILEEFFRDYFDDQSFVLPKIRIYSGKFTNLFTKLIGVHGITFGYRIFILPELVSRDRDSGPGLSGNLAAHEITHSLQYREHGFFGFFYRYLGSYFRNLRGREKWDLETRQKCYFEIPFEIEAREVAERFCEWNSENRKSIGRQDR